MKTFVIYTILAVTLACKAKVNNDEHTKEPLPIVIVSINQLDRIGFAKMLEQLSYCKPAVVGVMTLIDEKDSIDSSISRSFAKLRNVVLATLLMDDSVRTSNMEISKNAAGDGFVQFAMVNGKAVGHLILHEQNGGVIWSFPLSVLSQIDMGKTETIFESLEEDIAYRISFELPLESFEVIDGSKRLDCHSLESKIVLIGYTGKEADLYSVELNGEVVEMDITTAMANTILHLLNGKEFEEIR